MFIHDVIIEGPMDIYPAYCGIKLMNSSNINITKLAFFEMKQHAILISGHNNIIAKRKINILPRVKQVDGVNAWLFGE